MPFFSNGQTQQEKIDGLITSYQDLNYFNGTVLISRGGKVIFDKAYGYQNYKTSTFNSAESVFQIGSLTKPFTSMIILKLAEGKKLSLQDRLQSYFPEFKYGSDITIEQLLTHTSGVYENYKKQGPEILFTNRTISAQEISREIFSHPLNFSPGSRFSYSNSGYNLLGLIIEKVTGSTYKNAVNQYIFKPAGMKNSGYNFQKLKSRLKTTNYSYWSATQHLEEPVWNPAATFSSGALYSTSRDLYKWYQSIRDNKIISKEATTRATTTFKDGYGYGWFIDSLYKKKIVSHGGNIEGATSYFLMDPVDDICIILLNNINNVKLERVGNTILGILLDKPYSIPRQKQAIQLDEQTLDKFVGNYELSENHFVIVSKEGAQLYIEIDGEKRLKIFPEKAKSFFIPGEDIDVNFVSDQDGVKQVRIRRGLLTRIGDKVKAL
ncbi:serine hydrolase [Desertivirga brevis]|uniref:serine hydrolase n=1 Tax=Desertivirga brevis TaxID=2810310 RepID=UPI001A95900D|nr:serine hydrolase [Pedobacter sp. SYSU D00873]